jgi:LysM repeat protein
MRWKLFVASAILGSLVFQTLTSEAEQREALAVPYASQFDGSQFAATDCGPASVAMAINYATGEHLTPLQARQAIMRLPGGGYAANPASGTAVQDLAKLARAHNVEAFTGDGAASTGWGPERIRVHLQQGHPVIVLTRLGYLAGYNPSSQLDHYILLTGANGTGYVYNDPASPNGAKRAISEKQLQAAQRASGVPGQGVAFAGPASDAKAHRSAPAPQAAATRQVTVARGDTLSQLAERYGVELQQIVALNGPALRNIHHIEVGQVLKLPLGSDQAQQETPRAVAAQ